MTEADCSRVTHPSAANVLLRPLDLHVLSTPPAFVLSQNQTLMFNDFSTLSDSLNSIPHSSNLTVLYYKVINSSFIPYL